MQRLEIGNGVKGKKGKRKGKRKRNITKEREAASEGKKGRRKENQR